MDRTARQNAIEYQRLQAWAFTNARQYTDAGKLREARVAQSLHRDYCILMQGEMRTGLIEWEG